MEGNSTVPTKLNGYITCSEHLKVGNFTAKRPLLKCTFQDLFNVYVINFGHNEVLGVEINPNFSQTTYFT